MELIVRQVRKNKRSWFAGIRTMSKKKARNGITRYTERRETIETKYREGKIGKFALYSVFNFIIIFFKSALIFIL